MLVFAGVFLVSYLRQPVALVHEEPVEFWDRVSSMSPLGYIVEPWAGYFQIAARAVFLVGHTVDSVLVTRLLAAAIIAAVAAFLASDRMAEVFGGPRRRLLFGLSLAFLPVPGAFVGPLNGQWWIAILLVAMALTPRRTLDYPVILIAGFSGIAPCLALPVFRDRRGLLLLVICVVQGLTLLASDRRPTTLEIPPSFVLVAVGAILVGLLAQVPRRTRLAFAYLGLVTIALGTLTQGPSDGASRYLPAGTTAIALGIVSLRRTPELQPIEGQNVGGRAGVLRRHEGLHALLPGRRHGEP